MIIRKQDRFSLRKLSNGQLASVLLGSVAAAGTQTVEAKIVDNGDGTSTISNKIGSTIVDTDTLELRDVEGKNKKVNIEKTISDGHDTYSETGKVKYKYVTKTGEVLEESDLKDSGVTKNYNVTYDVYRKSGKLYKNLSVTEVGTIDKEAGTKETIVKNGKTYRRVGDSVLEKSTNGISGEFSNTRFNDVNLKTTNSGLIKANGGIDYSNVSGGRTWIVEEKSDGTYGKYVLADTPTTLDDNWTVNTFKTNEASAKDFNNENVTADGGVKEGDHVFVLEKDNYTLAEGNDGSYTIAGSVYVIDLVDAFGNRGNSEISNSEYSKIHELVKSNKDNLDHFKDTTMKNFIVEYYKHLTVFSFEDNVDNFKDYFFKYFTNYYDGDVRYNSPSLVDGSKEKGRELDVKNGGTLDSSGRVSSIINYNEGSLSFWLNEDIEPEKVREAYEKAIRENKTPDEYMISGIAAHFDPVNITYRTEYTPLRAYNISGGFDRVTYTYEEEKPKTGSVVVKYETKDGVQLKEAVTVKDNVEVPAEGVHYSTTDNAPDKLTDSQGNVYYLTPGKTKEGSAPEEGNVEAGKTLEVTYIYEPAGNVVVHYKNLDTGETLKDDLRLVDNGKAGDNYTTLTEEAKLDYIDKEGKRYSIVFNQVEGDETGNVESGVTKEITYYYTEEKKARLIVNYYKEGTEEKLLDSKITENLEVGSDYITRPEIIDAVEEEIDEDARRLEKIKRYELVDRPMNDTGTIVEGDNVVNYYYREVNTENIYSKQAPVVVNHYKEGTTEKLAPSVDKGRMDIGSKYTTEGVSIPSKIETEEFDDRTVTKTKTYELVADPENKNGEVVKGGVVVNYYYREVVKEDIVYKTVPEPKINVSYTGYDVRHVFENDEKYVQGSLFKNEEFDDKTEVVKRVFKASVSPGDGGDYKKAAEKAELDFVKALGYKSVEDFNNNQLDDKKLNLKDQANYTYWMLYATVQDSVANDVNNLNNSDGIHFRTEYKDYRRGLDSNYEKVNIYETLFPSGVEIENNRTTYRIENGEEIDIPTKYKNFGPEERTAEENKTTHFTYYYRLKKREEVKSTEEVKGSVVVKYVDDKGNELAGDVQVVNPTTVANKVTKDVISGTVTLDTKVETENIDVKYDTTNLRRDTIVKDGITYRLEEVLPAGNVYNNTTEETGNVKPGVTTVVYKYTPVKKGGLTVNYYKENSVVKLTDSEVVIDKEVGSDYNTEAKIISSRVETEEFPDRAVTRNISYELIGTPENAQGKISESETIVNYYYREVVKEDVAMKKDGLTVNFYKEGTKDKLADSIVEIDKVIGSDYTTMSAVIPVKVVTEELPDRTITRTISYELVKTPENANGKIVQGGTVVNYYYREIVKEDVNMKKDGLTVNFYKEGTKDKLADSVVEGDKVIGSDYTTTPKEIQGRVENEDLPDRTVKRVISYVLTGTPENANGKIVSGGTIVDYYYREVVKEDITMKKDGVVANYYKVGTKEKLAESEVISDKAIGSDYTTTFKTIEPKVTVVDLPDKVVRRTVRYELVERPFNENGKVVRGGTVVDYYYKEIVDEEVTPKKKNSSYANSFSVVKKKLAAYATSFTIRTLKR